ncbi:MAG: amidohydrolase family protein [Actinomycetaceae bacterium]|nr:amidohydrolase family protein [Actinomycetaceae bacterium]
MILRGYALWREIPTAESRLHTEPAAWIDGTFEVREGHIYRSKSQNPADYTGWITPGLVDVHCHIGIGAAGAVDEDEMLAQARADRASGVLLARDCGVPVDNSVVTGRPDTLRLIRSGTHIAKPKRYIRGLSIDVEDECDLPGVMAAQAENSDGWVKVVGDWIDRSNGADSDLQPLWSTEALIDGVAAAHEARARVTVHAFGRDTIDGLLEAGVDCIEHGTGMTDDHVREAVARGIAVTPTLMQVALFDEFAEQAGNKYPVYASTMRRLQARNHDLIATLYDCGVQLLPGTDAGGYQAHGQLPGELALWERAGISAGDIIDYATWRARDFLSYPALYEGAPADVCIYADDPRTNISAIAQPVTTMLAGRVQPA